MDALFMRSMGGLVPADDATGEWLKRVRLGASISADIRQQRNPQFHRKMLALFRLGFDHWSEIAPKLKYRGEEVAPDFDRFRKDVTILAGHFKTVVNLKGEIRLEADSISVGSMDAATFETLYTNVIQVLLTRVFTSKSWSEEKLRELVDQIAGFA